MLRKISRAITKIRLRETHIRCLKSISLVSSDEGLKDYMNECEAPLIDGSPACLFSENPVRKGKEMFIYYGFDCK